MSTQLDTPSLTTAPETPPDPKHQRDVLDAEKRALVVGLIAAGLSTRKAAIFVNCAPSTITRTAQRDPEFAEQLARATCTADLEALRTLRHAAREDRHWRAAAWLLERRNPDEYGRPAPNTLTAQEVTKLVAQLVGQLPPNASREKSLEQMEKELAETIAFHGMHDEVDLPKPLGRLRPSMGSQENKNSRATHRPK